MTLGEGEIVVLIRECAKALRRECDEECFYDGPVDKARFVKTCRGMLARMGEMVDELERTED